MVRQNKLLAIFLVILAIEITQCFKTDPVFLCTSPNSCFCDADLSLLNCSGQLKNYDENEVFSFKPSEIPSFRKLDLSNNDLLKFSGSRFLSLEQQQSVEELDLSSNRLWESEEQLIFDNFGNLKVLNLSNNGLNAFEKSYHAKYYKKSYPWLSSKLAETLEVLDLSGNNIATFPHRVFSEFKKLRVLILDNNRNLEQVYYYNDFNMPNLEELSLNNCSISGFGRNIMDGLKGLKRLSIRNNKLEQAPDLSQALNLEFLDLSSNNIYSVTYGILGNNPHLETLLLGNNRIRSFNLSLLRLYKNLKKLDLSNNFMLPFTKTYTESFSNSYETNRPALEELDLTNCHLDTLEEGLFNWKNLKSLKLKGNWFNCDESLAWLILNHSIPIEKGENSASCAYPEALRGKRLHEINEDDIKNPTETAVLYYTRKAFDFLTQNQPLFFFVLGAVSACLLLFALKCMWCCLCCCVRRVDQRIAKINSREKLTVHLLASEPNVRADKPEDTQTIVSTVTEE